MPEGTYICYEPKKFTAGGRELVDACNVILEEYAEQGYTLTVRQVFYQGVARGLWENTQRQYNRISNALNDGRLAGLVSWMSIEDRERNLMGLDTVSGPGAALKNALEDFRLDLWADQRFRPEVWVEKRALESVIGQICNKLRVDFFSCKGYNSQSEQWRAGRRFANYIQKGQTPIVFHLGDHDPSGMDMTRDNRERLELFAGVPVTVVRLALNMDQVEQYDPPPNPLKLRADGEFSDSRARAYFDQFGESSWELDALSPKVISDIILENVLRLRNEDLWQEALAEETNDKMVLEDMLEQLGDA